MAPSSNSVTDVETLAKLIPYLLSKPNEWLVTGRANYNFILPREYLPDAYKDDPEILYERFPYLKKEGRENITVKALENSIDFSEFNLVQVDEMFSIFLSRHQKASSVLTRTLLEQKTVEDFFSACVCVRERVNPTMFAYALTVALNNRPEAALKNIELPSLVSTFPQYFLPSSVIRDAREKLVALKENERIKTPIEVRMQYTATDLEHEQRVAYFREDIGLNLHHWHWHLVYPHDDDSYKPKSTQLPKCDTDGHARSIVNKDRRGELFYYMHQQMVARYNFERLSNRMARVRPLKDLQEPVVEGYFSKLVDTNSGKVWPARQPNSVLKSVTRELEQMTVDIDHMKRLTDRILSAIDAGSALTGEFEVEVDKDGKPVTTSKSKRVLLERPEGDGIDILGNIIESTCLSVNRDYYGDLHNMGHVLLALVHDPDGRFKEGVSLMGSVQTACRDPVFWRWHAHINDLFTAHKNKLEPYTKEYLQFDCVKVKEVNVYVDDCPEENVFRTFWKNSNIDIAWGIDYAKGEDDGPLYASIPHLDHRPFSYHINYHNPGEVRDGTVRIFMAPKYDESFEEFTFFHQKNLFIELDRFVTTLQHGDNVIKRSSKDSSVTIPWEQTFRSIGHMDLKFNKEGKISEPPKGDPKAYCGCGWPAHLLIPRGNGEGLDVDLFVMISNAKEDKVAEFHGSENEANCRDAMSYCGLKNSLYPDKKPMGFPFDRRPRVIPGLKGEVKLKDFVTENMAIQSVKIRFNKEPPLLCLPKLDTLVKQAVDLVSGSQTSSQDEIKKILDELTNWDTPPKAPVSEAPPKATVPVAPPKAAASETSANSATSEPPSKSATKSDASAGTTTGPEKLPANTAGLDTSSKTLQAADGKTQQG